MRETLPTALDTKYKSILSRERSLAKTVAHAVVKPKQISVWEVMIPILFIFSLVKLKQTREISAQNFLFTKELALEAALDMIKNGQARHTVMSQIEDRTSGVLAADDKGIYSEEIRLKQLKEIDLLIDHYCKLLEAEGEDYASLVINAYKSQEAYIAFLGQLNELEKKINLTAQQVLGTETAAEVISRMEVATDRARMAEAEKIFGTTEDAE